MISTLLLVFRLALFVDQCDGNTCAVLSHDGTPSTMPQSTLPACAHEGTLLFAGQCLDTSTEPSEAPRIDDGADIDLDTPVAEPDHAKHCPGDWLGHMDRPTDR
jgi:hypothetical protein